MHRASHKSRQVSEDTQRSVETDETRDTSNKSKVKSHVSNSDSEFTSSLESPDSNRAELSKSRDKRSSGSDCR